MDNPPSVRIDKWLWAVRLFKTRSLATTACRNGKVLVGDIAAKPSREVKINDLIKAQNGDVTRTFKVLTLLDRRVSASLVKEYVEDLTPPAELQKARDKVLPPMFHRPKGAGRPTKKERRAMDQIEGF